MPKRAEFEVVAKAEPNIELSHSHNWRGFSTTRAKVDNNAAYDFSWNDQVHFVSFHDLVLRDGEVSVETDGIIRGEHRFHDLRDTLTYAPAGSKITGWSQTADRPNAFTNLYFDPNILAEELEATFSESRFLPRIYFNDNNLKFIFNRLSACLSGTGAIDKLHVETLGLLAAVEIGTNFQRQYGIPHVARNEGLTPYQIRTLNEYIAAHLGDNISLDELAKIAGLSRFHLSKMFKKSYGVTPYHYVIKQRVEKAASLLRESNLSVSEIGLAVGFNSASQFIKAFVTQNGTTLARFRR